MGVDAWEEKVEVEVEKVRFVREEGSERRVEQMLERMLHWKR